MRRVAYISILILSSCICLFPANYAHSARKSVDKDIIESDSGYVNYFLHDSPVLKPHIAGIRKLNQDNNQYIFIDKKGYIWEYTSASYTDMESRLSCYDDVGKLLWTKTSDDFEIDLPYPSLMCENGIIFSRNLSDSTYKSGSQTSEQYELILVNHDGDVLWHSDPLVFESRSYSTRIRKISNNRILVNLHSRDSNKYYICSLRDGKLLEEVIFPFDLYEFNIIYDGPDEVPGKGWIVEYKDKIIKFNLDMTQDWAYKVVYEFTKPYRGMNPTVAVYDNIVLIGTQEKLVALDVDTGNPLWQKFAWAHSYVKTNDGDFLLGGNFRPDITMEDIQSIESIEEIKSAVEYQRKTILIDKLGNEVWTADFLFSRYFSSIVKYKDGNILFCADENLILINKEGSILWSMDFSDFKNEDSWSFNWGLYAIPNRRIIVSLRGSSFNANDRRLLILTQPGDDPSFEDLGWEV